MKLHFFIFRMSTLEEPMPTGTYINPTKAYQGKSVTHELRPYLVDPKIITITPAHTIKILKMVMYAIFSLKNNLAMMQVAKGTMFKAIPTKTSGKKSEFYILK